VKTIRLWTHAPTLPHHAPCCVAPQVKAVSVMMPAAQQVLSLLSRWPSPAAGTSSAVRGAACFLCQPVVHATADLPSNLWGCLPAPQLPQHGSTAGSDQHEAWRDARCCLPRPPAELSLDERRSIAFPLAPSVPLPLQPWAASAPRHTALQPRARQQVSAATTVMPRLSKLVSAQRHSTWCVQLACVAV